MASAQERFEKRFAGVVSALCVTEERLEQAQEEIRRLNRRLNAEIDGLTEMEPAGQPDRS